MGIHVVLVEFMSGFDKRSSSKGNGNGSKSKSKKGKKRDETGTYGAEAGDNSEEKGHEREKEDSNQEAVRNSGHVVVWITVNDKAARNTVLGVESILGSEWERSLIAGAVYVVAVGVDTAVVVVGPSDRIGDVVWRVDWVGIELKPKELVKRYRITSTTQEHEEEEEGRARLKKVKTMIIISVQLLKQTQDGWMRLVLEGLIIKQ